MPTCQSHCHDDTQHDDTQHDDIQHDDTQHDDTQHDDTQHDDTQHDDSQHNGIALFFLVSFMLSVTNKPLILGVNMLSVVMLCVVVPI